MCCTEERVGISRIARSRVGAEIGGGGGGGQEGQNDVFRVPKNI